MRGSPRLPSIDSNNAVSSPQIYAPLPEIILMAKSRPILLKLLLNISIVWFSGFNKKLYSPLKYIIPSLEPIA